LVVGKARDGIRACDEILPELVDVPRAGKAASDADDRDGASSVVIIREVDGRIVTANFIPKNGFSCRASGFVLREAMVR
jgi:hypothetical protein